MTATACVAVASLCTEGSPVNSPGALIFHFHDLMDTRTGAASHRRESRRQRGRPPSVLQQPPASRTLQRPPLDHGGHSQLPAAHPVQDILRRQGQSHGLRRQAHKGTHG